MLVISDSRRINLVPQRRVRRSISVMAKVEGGVSVARSVEPGSDLE